MAQRKKKPSGHQLEAIAKAHYKNEFMRKLKLIMNSIAGEDICSLIPLAHLETIYSIRCYSLKLVPAEGHLVSPVILNNMKSFFSAWVKDQPIPYKPNELKISLDDFFTVGMTIIKLYYSINEKMFPAAGKVKSALRDFCTDKETMNICAKQLCRLLYVVGYFYSDISERYYWLSYGLEINVEGKYGSNNLVSVYSHKSESIQVKINGLVRPASKLGWAMDFKGLEWAAIKPSLLTKEVLPNDEPINIYVQSHALMRLSERIDCVMPSILHQNMYSSFVEPKIYFDSHNNLLIEYRIYGTRTGYFKIDIVGDIVVVRTFLFLTNNGTPEGELLGKNTGLKMLDKKYLLIDKLSTFISSDICTSPQLKKIFCDSGCQSLFDLHDNNGGIYQKTPLKPTSEFMLAYLGWNNTVVSEAVPVQKQCDFINPSSLVQR